METILKLRILLPRCAKLITKISHPIGFFICLFVWFSLVFGHKKNQKQKNKTKNMYGD